MGTNQKKNIKIAPRLGTFHDFLQTFELPEIIKYCRTNRKNSVIPNLTLNGDRLTDRMVETLAQYCGAVAVSHYDPELCLMQLPDW